MLYLMLNVLITNLNSSMSTFPHMTKVKHCSFHVGGSFFFLLFAVLHFIYLGVSIICDMSDDMDVLEANGGIYGQISMFLHTFGTCTAQVKMQLFNAFCSVHFS
jgi:hypothetical protein